MTTFAEDLKEFKAKKDPSSSSFQEDLLKFKEANPEPPLLTPRNTPPVSPITGEEYGYPDPDVIMRNLDVPLGIAGSVGGAMVMAPTGPAGMAVGGTTGGALGTGVGTYLSEKYKDEPSNMAMKKAVENALMSVGFDIVTMGLASKLKPAWYAAKEKMGLSVEQIAREAVDTVYGVGSKESLEVSQKLLMQGGATLLPSQVRGTTLDDFQEQIASVGILSRGKIEANVQAVNQVIQTELRNIFNGSAASWRGIELIAPS